MELPLIKKITNQFLLVKKNFKNINRYTSMFNRFKIEIPQKLKNLKKNLINSTTFEENNKNNKIIKSNRNKNFYNKINDMSQNSNINISEINSKLNSNYYASSLSPIRNRTQNKFNNVTYSKYSNSPIKSKSNSLNIYDSFTEKRQINSNKNKSNSQNIIIPKIKKYSKIDKILTKFKLMKMIEDNTKNSCYVQEIKNNLFYQRHKKKLFNNKFIKHQINQHRHFIFDKNESSINKLNNYLINIDYMKTKKQNRTAEDIFKSLTKKEINIIKSDISYFKDIRGNIIKDLMKIKSNSKPIGLLEILNNAEQKDKISINNINQKKFEIKKNKNKEDEKILTNYGKYINKIINKDLSQRLHKIKELNINNGITKIIHDFPSKINIDIGKLNSVKSKSIEENCFRNFYNNLSVDMKKEYSIDKNRQRLLEENNSHFKKFKKFQKEYYEKDIIRSFTKKIKKIEV